MKRIKIISAVAILLSVLSCQQRKNISAEDLITHFEQSNFLETPDYAKTIAYSNLLAEFSDQVKYVSIGKSLRGLDIPMLIIDKDQQFKPVGPDRREKAVILIQACIHPGEPDGKDAGFMLIRDILTKKSHASLLDHLTLLFIPIFNVDGHERFGPYNRINQNGPKEMGWRTNARNLNLNRDFLKAESKEMQQWLAMFNQWLPDFFFDIHTTDGADYQYPLTYAMEIFGNMNAAQTEWQRDKYLVAMEQNMKASGFPVTYYVAFRKWHDPRSGLRSWVGNPSYSTGYGATQNRPTLLVETHMLKDYKTRVFATYELLKHSLTFFNEEHQKMLEMNIEADLQTVRGDYRKDYVLQWKNTNDSVMIDFLGYAYQVVESDLTGGLWFQYDSTNPQTYKIPYYNQHIPQKTVDVPLAYIVPVEWGEVIEKLTMHGVDMFEIQKDTLLKAGTYLFKNVSLSDRSYEGMQRADFETERIIEQRLIPAGSVIVPTEQRTGKVSVQMLEPDAAGSLAAWGFFNNIFEQKEYSETYVMEAMARQMLAKDPALQAEFDSLVAHDSRYQNNQWMQLNWFYSKTPYYDKKHNKYPILFIQDPELLKDLRALK